MSAPFLTAHTGRRDLDSSPIHGPHVIDGSPVARSTQLTASSDGLVSTHVWDCTAGKFHWYFGVDEIVHILEGEVHVTGDDGQTVTLRTGDVGHFPLHSHTVWDVPDYVCKLAFHRTPTLSLRVKRKLRRLLLPSGAVLAAPVVCSLAI